MSAIEPGKHILFAILGLAGLACMITSAHAGIAVTGDYNPDEPFWSNGGAADVDGTVAISAGGTLAVDGGSVLLTDQAILGYDADITGSATFSTGAQWDLSNDLEVGHDGIGFLDIYTGASVTADDDIYLGYNDGSEGTVVVDGNGSLLKALDKLNIGDDGTGYLTIQNQADASGGDVYIGNSSTSSGTVLVTGSGSTLHSDDQVWVGSTGYGSLTIQDGAEVTSGTVSVAYIGAQSEGEILVEGEGSQWMNTGDFYIGDDGTGTATVRNGGAISAGTTIIGQNDGASGSLTIETTIADSTASFTAAGELTLAGQTNTTGLLTVQGAGAQVSVTDDLKLSLGGEATLDILDGGAVTAHSSVVAGLSGYDDNTDMEVLGTGDIVVSGAGSRLDVTHDVVLGNDGTGNLTISDSAAVTAENLILAQSSGSTGTLLVEGADTTLDIAEKLIVASSGTGTATLRNGATVTSDEVFVGDLSGSDGTLHIESGATLDASYVAIADEASSLGEITVTGAGSLLSGDDGIVAGNAGNGSLTVSDGAAVTAPELSLAQASGSMGTLIVEDADSTIDLTLSLFVGKIGAGTATLRNGATVSAENTYLARGEGASGMLTVGSGATLNAGYFVIADDASSMGGAIVTGAGSLLSSSGGVIVGFSGTGTLAVSDGGTVDSTDLTLGAEDNSHGTLTIESGATFTTGPVVIAEGGSSTGEVTVTDDGSMLSGSGSIVVGEYGSGSLTVSSGAAAGGASMIIGQEEGSFGTVSVDAADSSLTVDGRLSIGDSGFGVLTISGGAEVLAGDTILGGGDTSTGSSLTVTGAGSRFSSSVNMTVGDEGAATLKILDGGIVDVTRSVYMGDNVATAAAIIHGEGSTWSAGRDMNIGPSSAATVAISAGGTLSTGWNLNIGSEATFNVLVDGDGTIQTGLAGAPDKGDFNNNGQINLIADPSLAAGTYTPISVAAGRIYAGSGAIAAVGGIWDDEAHQLTIGAITTDGTGDLSGRRVMYGDSLLVGFASDTGTQAFEVTPLDLQTIQGESVLGAYAFDTTITELTSLTFTIDGNYDENQISLWHLADGETEWTPFDASFYSLAGGKFTFATDSFSSYALTVVPEPDTWAVAIALGLAVLAAKRRRLRSAQENRASWQ